MKIIIITGTPCTGKTTLAKNLAKKMNFLHLDAAKLIFRHKLPEGYDKKRKTKIVDINKLNKVLIDYINFLKIIIGKNINGNSSLPKAGSTELIGKIKALTSKSSKLFSLKNEFNKSVKKYKGIIIDSHLSHYLPEKYVDFCIVTKCGVEELNRRLKKRNYHKDKIQENLQAEIFDVCCTEAIGNKHKVVVVDTTKSFNISSVAKQLGG